MICEGPGQSDEWYTPREIFDALRLTFDLDPCSPGDGKDLVPARQRYTMAEDGLSQPWHGLVWMNPPFGSRNAHVPWLQRFAAHPDGIAVVAARTSSAWFHEFVPHMTNILFPLGKTKFLRPDLTPGPSPWSGSVLMARGSRCSSALAHCNIGLCFTVQR